ncbi:hypothetical protein HF086_004138 [Spodoptera exigua]|uniref:FHA domain-containing protein n=1 Tax=Spodoptera exigua TaxID=7107 RepID=A0A922SDM7_SPOEX|nr:hypothetical protein HF086_004138 [Spodoptera exigua]
MWCLTSENDNRVIYILSSNQIVIGRDVVNQVCNFAIPNDPSISRRHVTLAVIDNELFLQDLGSKYGTFVNSNKTEHNVNIKLKENDVVKFGKINSVWKVKVIDLITCTSTLKGENLQNLKLTISKMNGILKGDWDDTCNYLTMPAITLTIKVVLALVQGSDIVTVDFWNKCLENITNFMVLPDPKEYLPKIVESTLNKEVVSFLPDSRRRTLFKGKKFVFFSKRQHEMYKTVLVKSGATPMLLSECRMTTSMLCAENMIVIQYIASGASQETQSQKKTINDIVAQLKNKGKRVVADAEIGLAILYCSLDKYCNPNFSFTSEVVKQTQAPVKQSKVLAPESQDPDSEQKKENIVIDESLMSEEQANNHSNKRKFSEVTTEGQVNANKKLATSCLVANVKTESVKRRLSDDDKSLNPTKKKWQWIKRITTEVQNSQDVKSDTNNTPKQNFSIFNINKKKNDTQDAVEGNIIVPKIKGLSADEISAMRGSKLKELMEQNSRTLPTLKKEKCEELEEQMNKLDLCCTIVTSCNNLIVKRESIIETDISSVHNTSLKNFKKFKKVWPIRRSTCSINASSINLSDNTAA